MLVSSLLRNFSQNDTNHAFFARTARVFAIQAVGACLAFLCQIIISRSVGVETYGALGLLLSLANTMVVFPLLGMDTGIIRSTASSKDSESRKMILNRTLTMTTILLLIFLVFTLPFGQAILRALKLDMSLLWSLLCMTIVLSYSRIFDGFLQGEKRNVLSSFLSNLVSNSAKFAFLSLLYLHIRSLPATVFVLVLIETLMLLLKYCIIRKKYHCVQAHRQTRADTFQYLRYCVPLFLIAVIGIAQTTLNRFALGFLTGNYEVGILRICENYAAIISLFVSPFSTMWPMMSECYQKNQMEELRSIYEGSTLLIALFAIPTLLTLTICSSDALAIFGMTDSNDKSLSLVMFLLLAGNAFDAIAGPAGALLNMTKHSKANLYNNILFILFSILAVWLLIPRFGLLGCAIAGAAAQVLGNALSIFQNRRLLNFFPYSKTHGFLLFMAFPLFFASLQVKRVLNFHPIANLSILFFLTFSVFFLVFIFLKRRSAQS